MGIVACRLGSGAALIAEFFGCYGVVPVALAHGQRPVDMASGATRVDRMKSIRAMLEREGRLKRRRRKKTR